MENSSDPSQMPDSVAFDLGPHCQKYLGKYGTCRCIYFSESASHGSSLLLELVGMVSLHHVYDGCCIRDCHHYHTLCQSCPFYRLLHYIPLLCGFLLFSYNDVVSACACILNEKEVSLKIWPYCRENGYTFKGR